MTARNAVTRNLIVVLGDQLNRDSLAFEQADASVDSIWMAETAAEADHVWNHKARIAIFLSAMRHFRNSLMADGWSVSYRELTTSARRDSEDTLGLAELLIRDAQRLNPQRIILVEPGEWRLKRDFQERIDELGIPLTLLPDNHFLATPEEFADHAQGRKQLRLEFFYREMRRKHQVLLDDDQPVGGKWNYDDENRGAFTKKGPQDLPKPVGFPPDSVTRQVLKVVESRFANHPGRLEDFDWPVTPQDAEAALNDFIDHRLHGLRQVPGRDVDR